MNEFPVFETPGNVFGMFGFAAPLNPMQFASESTAEQMAKRLRLQAERFAYSVTIKLEQVPFLKSGSPFYVIGNSTMWTLVLSDSDHEARVNAGELASFYLTEGDHPWVDSMVWSLAWSHLQTSKKPD